MFFPFKPTYSVFIQVSPNFYLFTIRRILKQILKCPLQNFVMEDGKEENLFGKQNHIPPTLPSFQKMFVITNDRKRRSVFSLRRFLSPRTLSPKNLKKSQHLPIGVFRVVLPKMHLSFGCRLFPSFCFYSGYFLISYPTFFVCTLDQLSIHTKKRVYL